MKTLLAFLVSLRLVYAFDYIVAGGGTAGLAVASRLAEDKSVTVLVLEAGPNAENLPEIFIPGLVGTGAAASLNWAYKTVPQANLGNRQVTVNAGKGLGGSTLLNSMIFTRASKEQYDSWGALNNDSSWTWNNLLPFFKRSEKFTPPNAFQALNGATYVPDVHGISSSGRVKVGFPNFFYPQYALWRNASGFVPSSDLTDGNPEHQVGVAPDSIDAVNNTRCSSACAYFTPFADEPNFTVITNATVTKIIWAPQTPGTSATGSSLKAVAVQYISNNQVFTANVTKEVIISAGTIGSPKILELSGVGNATILKAAGVQPVLNLPTVGENLADHVHSWTNAFTNATLTKDALLLNPDFLAAQKALWFKNRTGVLSAVPRSLGIAAPSDIFTPSQLSSLVQNARGNLTQFAQQYANGNAQLVKGIEAQHNIVLSQYQSDNSLPLEINGEPGYSGPTPFATRPRRNYTTINVVLYAPLSRGRTHITSSDPTVPPAVDPAYWSHPMDVAAQVNGIKLARKMMSSPPLDSIFQGEFEPGTDKVTDGDIEAWLRSVVGSDNHEVGTVAMMPKEMGGVVNTQLQVYGIQNVRVVDASIIPVPISSHLSATVYMIGEKAASMIKGGGKLS